MADYDPTQDAEWVSCSEAARRCGVSRQAVRDRIRRGSLEWMPDLTNPKTKLVCVKELARKKSAGRPIGSKTKKQKINLNNEQFQELFDRWYERGSNINCLRREFSNFHDSSDFDWWEEAFDAMIDWAMDKGLIA